jgi:alpha-1,2-mannosyltransferase
MLLTVWTALAVVIPVLAMIAVIARRILGPVEKNVKSILLRFLTVLTLGVVAASASTVLDTYQLGQVGVLLAALVVYDLVAPDSWRGLGRFRIPKGVGVGLATAIKLTPAIFIVHLMATRQWRTAINAILTTLTSWALAFIIFPTFSVYFWFQGGLFRAATDNEPARIVHEDNISIGAAFDRIRIDLGADIETMSAIPRLALLVVVGILGLLAASYLHRARRSILAILVVGLTATLVSPISWLHAGTFLALLAPTLFLIAIRARREGKYSAGPLYVMGVAMFAVVALPSQIIDTRFHQPPPIDGLYFTFALILSIAALAALGRQKDTEVTRLD